jgi:hypothetical protein
VGVGEGVAVGVGVVGIDAVQSKVPESHAGSVMTNLKVPWALPSVGNWPATLRRKGGNVPSNWSSTIGMGIGQVNAACV